MSQIKLLLDVIADIRSLGDSLETLAQALTANEVGNLDDYEEITILKRTNHPLLLNRLLLFSSAAAWRKFPVTDTPMKLSC